MKRFKTLSMGAVVATVILSLVAISSSAQNDDSQGEDAVYASKYWDCICNDTGKSLLLTLASGHHCGCYYVPKGKCVRFPVRKDTKEMAYVAFEAGTNNLISHSGFVVLHQKYPPTNCLHIFAKKEAERKTTADKEETPSTTVPF
jgi:hypothetical protein